MQLGLTLRPWSIFGRMVAVLREYHKRECLMSNTRRILIAGADDADVDRYTEALSDLGCRISTVRDDADMLCEIGSVSPRLVLIHAPLKSVDASELCRKITQDTVAVVIMLVPPNDLSDTQLAVGSGTGVLAKPVDVDELRMYVEKILEMTDLYY